MSPRQFQFEVIKQDSQEPEPVINNLTISTCGQPGVVSNPRSWGMPTKKIISVTNEGEKFLKKAKEFKVI